MHWSSTKNTGATMVKYEEEGIEPAALKGHELVFDITDYAKNVFAMTQAELSKEECR